jgi:hypothetical protein
MKVIEEDDFEGGIAYMKLLRGPLEPTKKSFDER